MKEPNKLGRNRVMDYICYQICEGCDQDPAKCFNQGYCEHDGPDGPDEDVQENE